MTGERLDLQLPRDAFRDPDALDTLQWQLSAESGQWPAGLGFDPQTLRLSGTPSAPGSYPLLLSATDDFGATATLTCALSIQSRPVLRGSGRDDELQGSAGPDVLYGLAGNDRLLGLAGNDRLFGGAGSDALFGAAGNDRLDGGPGADRLAGGAGNDRYVFARGSGSDHIVNGDIAGDDEIVFKQCRPRDLSFHRQGTALEITRRGSGDRVHLAHWFESPAARVDHIRLDDGHDLRAADVAVLVQAMARFEPASGAARLRWGSIRMIDLEKTDRGFLIGRFADRYAVPCHIQESSLAEEDCIWLGCDSKPMHLTRSMAVDIVMHLQRFIETGELR
jgi:hypothetical protein